MASKNPPISTYLNDEDYRLFKIAMKKYGMKQAEFCRQIIQNWLFNNKLLLKEK